MSTFWSGNGGSVVINGTTLNVGKWTVRKTMRLVENTHSGVANTNFEGVVPHFEGSFEIPWDSSNIPDTTLGLTGATKLTTLTLNYGRSTKFQTFANCSVESLEEVNDNANDIVRAVCSWKGGSISARALP